MPRPQESDDIQIHIRRAQDFFNTGQVAKALDELSSTIAAHPSNSQLLAARAAIYRQQGDPKAALHDLDKALRVQPTYPWPRLQRALVLSTLGRNIDADDEFDFLTGTIAPDVPEYHLEYGHYLYQQQALRPAIGYFDKAINLAPELEIAYLYRGSTSQILGSHSNALTDLYQQLCLSSQRILPRQHPNVTTMSRDLMHKLWGEQVEMCLTEFETACSKLAAARVSVGFRGNEFLPATEVLLWASNESNKVLHQRSAIHPYFNRLHYLVGGGSGGRRPSGCSYEQINGGTLLQAVPQRLWAFVYLLAALLHEDVTDGIGREEGELFRALTDSTSAADDEISTLLPILTSCLTAEAQAFASAVADLVMAFIAIRESNVACISVLDIPNAQSFGQLGRKWCEEIWGDAEAIRHLKRHLPPSLRPEVELRTWVYAISSLFTFVSLYDPIYNSAEAWPAIPPPSLRLEYAAQELLGTDVTRRHEALGHSRTFLERLTILANLLGWSELGKASEDVQHSTADFRQKLFLAERYTWFQACLPPEIVATSEQVPQSALPQPPLDSFADYEQLVANAIRSTPDETALPQPIFDAQLEHATCESKQLTDKLLSARGHGVVGDLTSLEILFVDDPALGIVGCHTRHFEGGRAVIVIPVVLLAALDAIGGLLESAPPIDVEISEAITSLTTIPVQWHQSIEHCRITSAQMTCHNEANVGELQRAFAPQSSSLQRLATFARLRSYHTNHDANAKYAPSNLGLLALKFIIAHEVAHHLKRHLEVCLAFRNRFGLTLPLDALNWALELEADSIAARSCYFDMKSWPSDQFPRGFALAEHDGIFHEQLSVLRAVLLVFGLIRLQSSSSVVTKELDTSRGLHPELGIRLRSIREWCYCVRNNEWLYIAASLEFAHRARSIGEHVNCPIVTALGGIALLDETSESEYRCVWECIEAIDLVIVQLVMPGVPDEVILPRIEEIGDKLSGVSNEY